MIYQQHYLWKIEHHGSFFGYSKKTHKNVNRNKLKDEEVKIRSPSSLGQISGGRNLLRLTFWYHVILSRDFF